MTRSPVDESSSDVLKPAARHSGERESSSRQGDSRLRRNYRSEWGWCVAIAMAFAAWSLRTRGSYNIPETDAARHAMNGVFLHDLIVRGEFTQILAYARNYYAHLPALSMPYHPPLFPLMEAVSFFIFGVNVLAAKLVVAATVALSAVVLCRLVAATHKSTLVAVLSTITFLSLRESMWVGGDVMLEYPALVTTLLAMYCLQGVDTVYSMRRGLVFAFLGGAAVWTKQQTVFLIAMPFLYFALTGRWRLLLKAPIWVSTGLFAAAAGALAALSIPFNSSPVSMVTTFVANGHHATHLDIFRRNFYYYASEYSATAGPAAVILLAVTVVALIFRPFNRKSTALYVSWILASMALLLVIRPISTRYLFFTFPAIITLGYAGLIDIVTRVAGKRQYAVVTAVLVLLTGLVWQLPLHSQYLHGPEDAARMLADLKPNRILYCGRTDGYFIFSFRSLHAGLDTTIISGDKLSPEVFTPSALETFAHDYGVQYIVLESIDGRVGKRPWDAIVGKLPDSIVAEREIKLEYSGRGNGLLRVYRFANPSPTPKEYLSMRMQMIGGTMGFQLNQ